MKHFVRVPKTFLRGIGLVLAAVSASAALPEVAQADPNHPFGEDGLSQCAVELNNSPSQGSGPVTGSDYPWDVTIPDGISNTVMPAWNDPTQTDCWNMAWGKYTGELDSFTVSATFGGPDINTSAWDCNHSTVEYAIYGLTSNDEFGAWVYLRGGLEYGALVNGTCTHSVTSFPPQTWGADSQRTWGGLYPDGSGAQYRIATRSWAHNDTAFGHPGNLCADINCYFTTTLHVSESN